MSITGTCIASLFGSHEYILVLNLIGKLFSSAIMNIPQCICILVTQKAHFQMQHPDRDSHSYHDVKQLHPKPLHQQGAPITSQFSINTFDVFEECLPMPSVQSTKSVIKVCCLKSLS